MLDYIGFTFKDFDSACVVIVNQLSKSSQVYYLAGGAGGKMQIEGMAKFYDIPLVGNYQELSKSGLMPYSQQRHRNRY